VIKIILTFQGQRLKVRMAQLQAQVDDAEKKRLQDGDKEDDDAPTSVHTNRTFNRRSSHLPASVVSRSLCLPPLPPQQVQRSNFEEAVINDPKTLFIQETQYHTVTDTFGSLSQRQPRLLDRTDASDKLSEKQGSEILLFPKESSDNHEHQQHIDLDAQSNNESPSKLCANGFPELSLY
jgi:hypothetical protein